MTRTSTGQGSLRVLLAAVLILTLAATALTLARRTAGGVGGGDDARASSPAPSVEVPGFRADRLYLPDEDLLGFVWIDAGEFIMGSDSRRDSLAFDLERWPGSEAGGVVRLDGFWIARFEVTLAQYTAFVVDRGHPVPEPAAVRGRPEAPVAWVSWTDAVAYADWLDQALRQSPWTPPALRARLTEGWRVRLPNEAQWEKAARGSDARIFPWGDRADRAFATYAAPAATPVGSHPCDACAHGLSDMSGNVWEWTRSPYLPYPFDPEASPDLRTEALWIIRGGGYGDGPTHIRTANRGGADPGARQPFIGFRIVISPS